MLAMEIKKFIDTFIKSEELQKYSDYEDRLDKAIDRLIYLCTTLEECKMVEAIVSLEKHQKLNASDEHAHVVC